MGSGCRMGGGFVLRRAHSSTGSLMPSPPLLLATSKEGLGIRQQRGLGQHFGNHRTAFHAHIKDRTLILVIVD